MSEDGLDQLTHAEDGRPVPSVPFDYDQVDADIFGCEVESDLTELDEADLDRLITGLRALLQWVAKPGSKNSDGVKLRAIVVCWVFLKEFRPLQLSQLARGFAMEKQSLGRHVDDFKRTFPSIRTPHMRPLPHE